MATETAMDAVTDWALGREAKGCKACGHGFRQHKHRIGYGVPDSRPSGVCAYGACPCLLWQPPEPPSWVHRSILLKLNRRILDLGGPVVGCPACDTDDGQNSRWPCTFVVETRYTSGWCGVLSCGEHAYAARVHDRDGGGNIVRDVHGMLWVRDGRARCVVHRSVGDVAIGPK